MNQSKYTPVVISGQFPTYPSGEHHEYQGVVDLVNADRLKLLACEILNRAGFEFWPDDIYTAIVYSTEYSDDFIIEIDYIGIKNENSEAVFSCTIKMIAS